MRDLSEELFGKHFNGLHYEDITKDMIITFAEELVKVKSRVVVFKDGTFIRTESDLEASEYEDDPDWLVSIN